MIAVVKTTLKYRLLTARVNGKARGIVAIGRAHFGLFGLK